MMRRYMKGEGNNKNQNVLRKEKSKRAIVVTTACSRCSLWFEEIVGYKLTHVYRVFMSDVVCE